MSELFELVTGMADDDGCMNHLSQHCGIGDPAEVRSLYLSTIEVVREQLVELGRGSVAGKSLLQATRLLERTDRSDPKAQFEVGHLVGDELLLEVFGSHGGSVVDRLANDRGIPAAKARSVLEATTAVFLSAASAVAGDRLTFGSLATALADSPNGQSAEASANASRSASATPGALDANAVASTTAEHPAAASSDEQMVPASHATAAGAAAAAAAARMAGAGGAGVQDAATAAAGTTVAATGQAGADDAAASEAGATVLRAPTGATGAGAASARSTDARRDPRATASPATVTGEPGDGGQRARWWLVAVPVALLLVGVVAVLATSGGDDGATDSDADLALTDDEPGDGPEGAGDGAGAGSDSDADAGDEPADGESSDDGDGDGDSAPPAESSTDDSTGSGVTGDDATGSGDGDTSDDDATAGGSAPVGGPGPDSPPIPPGAPPRHAVVSNNQFFLRGYIADPSEAEQIVSAMENVFGEGNVIDEYILDPELAAQFPIGSTTVYIAETILFDTGSAVVSPEFTAILDFGVATLQMQEAITLVVSGHTDSRGDEAYNLELSQRRVDSVKQYFVDQGIAPDRIEAVGQGESDPKADNDTAEGRRANRRVEFLVENFTFGP